MFKTRWAMNYLTGPLTRAQIPMLNQLVGGAATPKADPVPAREPQSSFAVSPAPVVESQPQKSSPVAHPPSPVGSATRPKVPASIDEYFLPHNLTIAEAVKQTNRLLPMGARPAGMIYRPVVLALRRRDLRRSQDGRALAMGAGPGDRAIPRL